MQRQPDEMQHEKSAAASRVVLSPPDSPSPAPDPRLFGQIRVRIRDRHHSAGPSERMLTRRDGSCCSMESGILGNGREEMEAFLT